MNTTPHSCLATGDMESEGGLAPISEVVTPPGGSMTSIGRASRVSIDSGPLSPSHLPSHPPYPHHLQRQHSQPQQPSRFLQASFTAPTSTSQQQEPPRNRNAMSTNEFLDHSSRSSSQHLPMEGLQLAERAEFPVVMSLTAIQADSVDDNWLDIDSENLPSGIILRGYDDSSLLGSSPFGHAGVQYEGSPLPHFPSPPTA